jgi:hypothetical protein
MMAFSLKTSSVLSRDTSTVGRALAVTGTADP